MELGSLIDVWNVETFDAELRAALDRHAATIAAYWIESRRLFEEREAQTLRGPPSENKHGFAYQRLQEEITALMAERTIRAWHFTRLTDTEVAAIRSRGMQPMTIASIERRLAVAVAHGLVDQADADALFAASPYHTQIAGNRELRIWFTAQPYPLDDSGVTGLMDAWGGESINFNHRSGRLRELLETLGSPRVLEVAVPLAITTRIGEAATNVIDAFSFTLGSKGGWGGGADIVAIKPIKPTWILAVHSPGDPHFEAMGRGYPERFEAGD